MTEEGPARVWVLRLRLPAGCLFSYVRGQSGRDGSISRGDHKSNKTNHLSSARDLSTRALGFMTIPAIIIVEHGPLERGSSRRIGAGFEKRHTSPRVEWLSSILLRGFRSAVCLTGVFYIYIHGG